MNRSNYKLIKLSRKVLLGLFLDICTKTFLELLRDDEVLQVALGKFNKFPSARCEFRIYPEILISIPSGRSDRRSAILIMNALRETVKI